LHSLGTGQNRREEERVEQSAEQGRDWDWAARYAGGSLRGSGQQDILSSIFQRTIELEHKILKCRKGEREELGMEEELNVQNRQILISESCREEIELSSVTASRYYKRKLWIK
jgi:hypothetical protein